jgi:histidine triad (HIT) family protein
MDECIFCQIVAGHVPCSKVMETELTFSFLDIAPVNPGHCLIVPKRHVETIVDFNEQELAEAAQLAQKLAAAVMAATGSPGCNLLQNNHSCAGQLVPHAHFHIIPRSPDDGFDLGWRQQEYGEGEMEEMLQQIRLHL